MASDVFFLPVSGEERTSVIQTEIARLIERAGLKRCVGKNDLTALKIHFGDEKNTNYIKPAWTRPVVDAVKSRDGKPFLTDTTVLYKSKRDNAPEHQMLAWGHGFKQEKTGAPVIIGDGLVGGSEVEVEISGEIYSRVEIAETAVRSNSMIILTHVTGHIGTAMGAALKNLGMGFASRKGKLRQHSAMNPAVREKYCTDCGECIKWCPVDAITSAEGHAVIDQQVCIGCGECITMCRFGAISHDWKIDADELQKRIAEHALGAVSGKEGKVGYLNFRKKAEACSA